MNDAATKQPVRVSTDSTVGPYIDISVSQLDAVRTLLDQNGIAYSVDCDAISMDGGPEETLIFLGRNGDAKRVQQILDCAA